MRRWPKRRNSSECMGGSSVVATQRGALFTFQMGPTRTSFISFTPVFGGAERSRAARRDALALQRRPSHVLGERDATQLLRELADLVLVQMTSAPDEPEVIVLERRLRHELAKRAARELVLDEVARQHRRARALEQAVTDGADRAEVLDALE